MFPLYNSSLSVADLALCCLCILALLCVLLGLVCAVEFYMTIPELPLLLSTSFRYFISTSFVTSFVTSS
jgi:hypothetical protein